MHTTELTKSLHTEVGKKNNLPSPLFGTCNFESIISLSTWTASKPASAPAKSRHDLTISMHVPSLLVKTMYSMYY
jgi:hypothetical protein